MPLASEDVMPMRYREGCPRAPPDLFDRIGTDPSPHVAGSKGTRRPYTPIAKITYAPQQITRATSAAPTGSRSGRRSGPARRSGPRSPRHPSPRLRYGATNRNPWPTTTPGFAWRRKCRSRPGPTQRRGSVRRTQTRSFRRPHCHLAIAGFVSRSCSRPGGESAHHGEVAYSRAGRSDCSQG